MVGATHWIADRLVRWRWFLLLLGIAAGLAAFWPAGQVRFDRSIENMFAADDPLLPPYRKLQQVFGGNEIVLAVYIDKELLNPTGAGIRRLERISEQLEQVPGVRAVLSLAEISQTLDKIESVGGLFGGFTGQRPAIVDQDSRLAARYRALFEGYTHGDDGETAALVCMLESEREAEVPRSETIARLRRIMNNLPQPLAPGMLAGEPVMVVDGFRYVEQDGERLGWTSTILLALTIILCFRSLRWVLIPIAVVQLALLLTRAALVWAGLRLSMVSSMLTAIVTVVGIATVIHIIIRFRDARASGLSTRRALTRAIVLLAAPVFWACTTDAVGFASLMVAEVGPVQDFGIMMAVGSLMVLVSVVLLVPGLALLGSIDPDPRRAWGEGQLDRQLHNLTSLVEKAPGRLTAAVVLLGIGSIAGLSRLDVETDFTKNFRETSPVVRSYGVIERRLGGAGVWDVILPAPARLDDHYLDRVLQLERHLRAIRLPGSSRPALTKVISLADADQAAGESRLLSLLPAERRLQAMAQVMPEFVAALRSREPDAEGRHYFRIMLRAPERQSAQQKQWLIRQVQLAVAEQFPEAADEGEAAVTGFYVLLTNLISSMIRDQWICFGVASAGIALMMLMAFRSLPLALIALVPNVLPILLVLGGMGWLGVKINMGAAMIAAVSMGLSVDSSIHYITSFRRARAAGRSTAEATAEVQQTVGRAVVFSTLALIVGFTVLCTSQFVPTIYFGVLVSLSMLGGLFGNLLVLPLLLRLTSAK